MNSQVAPEEAAVFGYVPIEIPRWPVAPPEIAEALAAEAEQLESMEFFLCDLQRFPLGPAALREVDRIRGVLVNLSAVVAALQSQNLRE
jgi:hypothetical protein